MTDAYKAHHSIEMANPFTGEDHAPDKSLVRTGSAIYVSTIKLQR